MIPMYTIYIQSTETSWTGTLFFFHLFLPLARAADVFILQAACIHMIVYIYNITVLYCALSGHAFKRNDVRFPVGTYPLRSKDVYDAT